MAEVTAANDAFASRGYRVLGVASRQKEEQQPQDAQELEKNLIFIGLVAMIDPPRAEVADAIAKCHQAGIQVTMVTGDYGLTAEAIASKIGLVDGKARVVTGEDVGHLSDAQLRQILHQKSGLVFARVMPEQKLRLVQAYIAMGHIVAVTGDGVNDAPALRAANIGIAMGMSGTDVAREAADIMLIDDNFADTVGEWALILSIIYVAPLEKIFAAAPLSPWQWLMLLLCPPLILMADEVRKQFVYRIPDTLSLKS